VQPVLAHNFLCSRKFASKKENSLKQSRIGMLPDVDISAKIDAASKTRCIEVLGKVTDKHATACSITREREREHPILFDNTSTARIGVVDNKQKSKAEDSWLEESSRATKSEDEWL